MNYQVICSCCQCDSLDRSVYFVADDWNLKKMQTISYMY